MGKLYLYYLGLYNIWKKAMYVKALVSYIHWFEKFDLYRYIYIEEKFVMHAIMVGGMVILQYFRNGRFYV